MSLKLLFSLLRKQLIVFTPEEFADMMRPYEFTMKVARNLGKLESELHMSDDADQIIKRALKKPAISTVPIGQASLMLIWS
ncbi:MAG: hypothetical protein IKI93_03820 [Clostridia bacterium]|nr:hypothetical protein [Clostridia bacterium]